MQENRTGRKHPPAWALGIDQDQLDELGREDRWLREIEAGETPPPVEIQREWSTVKQVAERHALAEKTIRKYIREGSLTAVAHPTSAPAKQRRWRVRRDDELAWIEGKAADLRRPAKRATPAPRARRTFRERVTK
jgi:hypothetical protein